MLVDHIGVILFPEQIMFRIIGRLSMPLFAYCIARGFYHSRRRGTHLKYFRNMLTLALVSQIPYRFMAGAGANLNICFTWVFAILLLLMFSAQYPSPAVRNLVSWGAVVAVGFLAVSGLLPVDYGFYGVATPLLFFFLLKNKRDSGSAYFLLLAVTWAFYILVQRGSFLQFFSLLSAPLLTVGNKLDGKVKIPKKVFYAFYPAHIVLLLAIKSIFIV